MFCLWCDEGVDPTKESLVKVANVGKDGSIHTGYLHHECLLRSVLGSVAHQQHTCSCYGGCEEDPPGMTKREAAIHAARLFRLQKVSCPPTQPEAVSSTPVNGTLN